MIQLKRSVVKRRRCYIPVLIEILQNLREEVTMDVDDDEGTQRPRRVNDYGIEVDYSMLDEDEREVNAHVTER